MKIKFLGATNSVTGSKYILYGKDYNLLIDCGLFQGLGSEVQNKEIFNYLKHEKIDAIILTHAHLDHSGYLPKLVKDGFKGPIYSTAATKDIAKIILEDNASIQAQELKKINEHIQKNKNKLSALYEKIHVSQTLSLFQIKDFNITFTFKEFKIEFKRAGHILGASSPLIISHGKKVQFSGDLGRDDDLTMFAPEPAEKNLDALIMESTYGNRRHLELNYLESLKKFVKLNKDKGATLVIPAFSVGRSQTLMLALYNLFEKFPELDQPIYIDSPMTQLVTKVYHQYSNEHKVDDETLKGIEKKFHFVKYQSEKEKIDQSFTKIILTASGMLSGGRVLHHLATHGQYRENTFLIVGFQAPGTIGKKLLDGQRIFNLENSVIEVEAHIEELNLFSSHADHDELIKWSSDSYAKKIFITHGESDSKRELKSNLEKHLEILVNTPTMGETFEI